MDAWLPNLQVLPNVGKWEYMGPALVQGETVSLWQLKEQCVLAAHSNAPHPSLLS